MTTRILDARSAHLLTGVGDAQPFEQLQWRSVLKSLTAYQMYRRHVRLRVKGSDVLKFLLLDPAFPRSVAFCLAAVAERLKELPRHDEALMAVGRLQRKLDQADMNDLIQGGLSGYVDDLQRELIEVGDRISQTWFSNAATG